MELTIKNLLNGKAALITLGNTKGLSSVIAYRIAKNIKAIDEELKTFEETRLNIVKEYANKDKDGNPATKKDANGNEVFDIDNENMKLLSQEIEKLQDEKVNIDIKQLSLEEIDKAELSPLELSSIDFMIAEE